MSSAGAEPGRPPEVRGTIHLQIDPRGVQVRATITPDPTATLITRERVEAALKAKSCSEGIDLAPLEKALADAAESNAPVTVTLARGVPPDDPTPETFVPADLNIPDELKEAAEYVLKEARPPVITRTEQEKVSRVEKVRRKAALPFLPDKVEERTVTDVVTSQKRVYIDPTVKSEGYASSGMELGSIEPGSGGVPGRSVFGQTIHPKALADPHFYEGPNVERKNGAFWAAADGFVRIGTNWVDIVPYVEHEWYVELNDSRTTALLNYIPGTVPAGKPSAADIRARAMELGIEEAQVLPETEIESLLAFAVEKQGSLEAVPVTGDEDSAFRIDISEDQMRATLYLRKATGRGAALNLKEVGGAIKKSGIAGLQFQQIQQDVSEFYKSTSRELVDYVLVEGKPPVSPPPREVEWAVTWLPEARTEELRMEAVENPAALAGFGSLREFPISDVTRMADVERDQRLATVTPAVPGEPGQDVYGKPVPPPEAPELPIQLYENVSLQDAFVVATAGGILDASDDEGTVQLRIRPHRDPQIQVMVSEDRMEARISLVPPEEGAATIAEERLRADLAAAGVKHGIREEVLYSALERVRAGVAVDDEVIAEGTPPSRSGGTRLELLVRKASGQSFTFRLDGSADYRTADRITAVTAGQEVARIHRAESDPQPGTDVTGREIPVPADQQTEITLGNNVEGREEEEGSRLVIATAGGELKIQNNQLSVEAGLTIKGDLDMKQGNIRFPGPVTVSGSVLSGFFVISGGDIQIGEAVEAALLSAEGNIHIKQGVKGGGKAFLRTKQAAAMAFAEQSTIFAVQDIHVGGPLLRCTVKCNGRIRGSADKSSIIGGEIRVRQGMEVTNIGAERGASTHIRFGQDFLIEDRIEVEEREVEKLKSQVTKIDAEMKRIAGSNQAKLRKLFAEKAKRVKVLEKRGLRIFALREKFEQHFAGDILVRGTVFPGTVFESHGRTREIGSPLKTVRIWFDVETGRILDEPIGKKDP